MGYSKKPKAPAIHPAALDLWRSFFDFEKTSIQDALGYFQIDVSPSDDKEDGVDPEQSVRFESFMLRPRQIEALKWVEGYFWNLKKRAARIITLKCRRYGVSTFWIIFGLERILRVPGYQVLLIAQDDQSAKKHFQRLRDAFSQVPEWILKERGIEVVKSTDNQLVLRHGGYRTSEFHVAPAKRSALGRGARYNFIIVTEAPHYPKSVKAGLAGLLSACRNSIGNITVFEATANGYEAFYRRYKRAEKRQSDYRAQFIAAFEHPENRKSFASGADEDAFIASIGTLKDFGPVDEVTLFRRLTVDLGWTPHDAAEHLNWRRTEIADTCEGSIEFYHQENPNTAAEAFLSTGAPIFRKDVLEAWRQLAEERENEAWRLHLAEKDEKVEALDDPRADLFVFEKPIKGRRYCFGADVASGKTMHADGKTEADFSVCVVKEVRSGITVARFRAHIAEGEYSRCVFLLACYYNGARGYVERTIFGSSVVIGKMSKMELGEWHGSDRLLSQIQAIATDASNVRKNWEYHPGFQTTGSTKPELVDNIRVFVKETGIPDGVKPCPWDLQTIEELSKFERVEGTARMEASEGHDDCVMAEGMALEARSRCLEDVEDEPANYKPPTTAEEILMDYCKIANAHKEEASGGTDPDMPGY